MECNDISILVGAARILELSSSSAIDFHTVRKSFCRMIKDSHPDRNNNCDVAHFYSLMDAYNVLRDFFTGRNSLVCSSSGNVLSYVEAVPKCNLPYIVEDDSHYIDCRCGNLVEIPCIALSLGIYVYNCAGCSCKFEIV